MERNVRDLIIGLVVLGLGISILVAVLILAYGVVSAPGDFLREQVPEEEEVQGPRASFEWETDGLVVLFTDKSEEGDATLSSWDWDFGDGENDGNQNPEHTYSDNGSYEVRLEVQDENGKRSAARGYVQVEWGRIRSGSSQPELGDFDVGLDMGNFGTQIAVAILMSGLYLVMFLVGAAITKAGWNIMKPKPEKVKVKLKPKSMEIREVGIVRPPPEQPPPPTGYQE